MLKFFFEPAGLEESVRPRCQCRLSPTDDSAPRRPFPCPERELAHGRIPHKIPSGLWRITSPERKQNRMTSALSNFARRLRVRIESTMRDASAPAVTVAGTPASLFPDDEFDAWALALFAEQFACNPSYHRICVAAGKTPGTVEHWTQIPTVPTTAFKEFDLTCLPADKREVVFHSSGTTRQSPSRHFHHAESLAVYETSLWTEFTRRVLPGESEEVADFQLALLTPPPAQAPHSSLVHMCETVRRRMGAPETSYLGCVHPEGGWTLNYEQTCSRLAAACMAAQPVLLLGTGFSLVHLLDHLASRGQRLSLPPGSRVMETGGYKGRSRTLTQAELHALITARLGVPPAQIVCEYGMSELSSQAYAAETQTGPREFLFAPWARARIISPETGQEVRLGETGLIQVFDLANVFSVMAIQTEDLGVRQAAGFVLAGRAAQAEPRGCSLLPTPP